MDRVLNRMQIVRLENVQENFVTWTVGRIIRPNKVLTAPISGNACVYYKVIVKKQKTRADTVESVRVISEEKFSDFYISDPAAPNTSIYVPFYSGDEVTILSPYANASEYYSTSNIVTTCNSATRAMQALCDRHGVSTNDGTFITYYELYYGIGQQVSCLGFVSDNQQVSDSINSKLLLPLNQDMISEETFQADGWSDWERRSWQALTAYPSIILCNDISKHNGIVIEKLTESLTTTIQPADNECIIIEQVLDPVLVQNMDAAQQLSA